MLPDRFSDLVELDSGGFATVYRAKDREFGVVALKTPKLDTEDLTARFKREVELQGEFAHPNIVEVLDFDLSTPPGWYLMPLADGNLLHALRDGTNSIDTLISLFRDVLSGVGHAHAKHILHRDLKPGNVLVYSDEGIRAARVSDFGLSRRFTRENMDFQTETAWASGTDPYTAPEQWSDFREATETADVFSLGKILSLILSVRDELGKSFPQLAHCVTVATRFDPLERYQSVEQFSIAVELALIDGERGGSAHDSITRAIRDHVGEPEEPVALDRLMDALEKFGEDGSVLRWAFARMPESAVSSLCQKHAGRMRSVILAYGRPADPPEPVDSAMLILRNLDVCIEAAKDERLWAAAFVGVLRLAALYRMTEFEEVALYRARQAVSASAAGGIAALLSADQTVRDWASERVELAPLLLLKAEFDG
jgi:hypothetical protein